MKHVSIVLLVVMVSMSSCAINEGKEMSKESKPSSFQPEPLDDEWNKWLIGKWIVRPEGYEGESEGGFKIEFDLNGQFLTMKSWAETGDQGETDEMTPDQIEPLKDTLNISDEDIEKLLSQPFKELQIHTIDPKTGERIGYLFDSLRCIAKGTGRLEGNKEIMEWEWSVTGQGATSVRIIERISDNKFTLNHKYTLPNGNKMEDKAEFTRKKIEIEK
jgi:hypothetical protein